MKPGSWTYLFLLIPTVLGWYAQRRVRLAYNRYATVRTNQGLIGADVAERLIAHLGLDGVSIALMMGRTGDHYDPSDGTLVLTEGIAASDSVTAMGIIAHEVLHAQQDAEGYALMRLRAWLGERLGHLPTVAMAVVLVGLALQATTVTIIGGAIIAASVVLGIVSLPVERNASQRALEALQNSGLADSDDLQGAQAVLSAAALTYLAGLAQYLGWLAFLALLIGVGRGLG